MTHTGSGFSTIESCLADLRAGKMVILTDDENRENEGDLVLPAQFATPEAITFMLQHALGYLCLSLPEPDCDRLELHPQSATNTTTRGTAFTVSIDLHPKYGGTTGVSAKERAKCIQMAIDPTRTAADFVRPGHINPLRSREGGVLVRTGQTEGSIDLCRLAGLKPAAVIIEIMKPDGEMARVPDLIEFCKKHDMKMCSVAQIIEHRLARESLIERMAPAHGRVLRTEMGEFTVHAFRSVVDPLPHLVLTVGGVGQQNGDIEEPVLVRMHRRHLLGDVFGDLDSGSSGATGRTLRASMKAIQYAGRGAVVYLRTNPHAAGEGDLENLLQSPLGVAAAARSAANPDLPALTSSGMSEREFGVGGQILRNLGIRKMRLLTNAQRAWPGLESFGLEIVETVRV
jgi:3,4-dihydroxy 2-butanone 4-phosphate synthase/GTP cyclohydrolase II